MILENIKSMGSLSPSDDYIPKNSGAKKCVANTVYKR